MSRLPNSIERLSHAENTPDQYGFFSNEVAIRSFSIIDFELKIGLILRRRLFSKSLAIQGRFY